MTGEPLKGEQSATEHGDLVDELLRMNRSLHEKIDALSAKVAALGEIPARVAELARTAPGRGAVALPGERLLVRISLPRFFPYFDPFVAVNADDKLIVSKLLIDGYYELESSSFAAANVKPGDHVIDVGANFGYYSVMLGVRAGWLGKVLSFEPHPKLARLLRENMLMNWLPWSRVIEAACSDAPGRLTLMAAPGRLANTGPVAPAVEEGFGDDFTFAPFEASAVAIDDHLDFLNGRVDFLKIDIEGGEPSALRGAQQAIKENPQIKIMMEWSPEQLAAAGHNPTKFADELRCFSLGCFTLDRGDRGTVTPISFDDLKASPYQNIVLMNA